MNEYDWAEIKRFQNDVAEIEKSPLQDRKDGMNALDDRIKYGLDEYLKRFDWLLSGDYGYGVLADYNRCTKRMNRRAWLFINLAILECRTSNKYARDIWNSLDKTIQDKINAYLDECIEAHDLELAEQAAQA